jgi:hypothetical protein
MATQVKSTASGLGKAKDQKDGQSYGPNVDLRFFCGVDFLGSMAPDEAMPHMSRDHESCAVNDGNHVMVPNFSEMISTVSPLIRASIITRNFGFCNCRMQLKFSYMRHMQLQICAVA